VENITRRSALIAAAAVGLSATASAAEPQGDKPGGDRSRQTKPLSLHITLPDGQVVELKAAELVIDFGGDHRLLVKPDGLTPGLDPSEGKQPGEGSKPH
jgi:hypothetical protein